MVTKTWNILILNLFFQNIYLQENQGEFYLIEDLQIKSPLQSGKRFLGWYVDGEWEVEDKNLTFLNFKEKSFLLTNNLLFKSEKLRFNIDFQVTYDQSKFVDKKPLINNPELFQISLFPGLYPISDFMPYSSKLYLWGYSLVFMTRKDIGYVVFAENMNLKKYDFQTFYQSNLPRNKNLYCQHDYRNIRTSMNINLSFIDKKLEVIINDKVCVTAKINIDLFKDQRATLTMNGYSSGVHPIKIQIKDISIYKFAYEQHQFNYMQDVQTFHQALHANLPGSFAEKKSLANLRLIQGKIDKEIDNVANQTELIAKRTEALEKIIISNKLNDKQDNKEEQKIEKLKEQLKLLQDIYKLNEETKTKFETFMNKFNNVENLYMVIEKFDEIDDFITELENILEIQDLDKFLQYSNNIDINSKRENQSIQKTMKKIQEKLLNTKIGNLYVILFVIEIVIIILFCWKIIKRINEIYKKEIINQKCYRIQGRLMRKE